MACTGRHSISRFPVQATRWFDGRTDENARLPSRKTTQTLMYLSENRKVTAWQNSKILPGCLLRIYQDIMPVSSRPCCQQIPHVIVKSNSISRQGNKVALLNNRQLDSKHNHNKSLMQIAFVKILYQRPGSLQTTTSYRHNHNRKAAKFMGCVKTGTGSEIDNLGGIQPPPT